MALSDADRRIAAADLAKRMFSGTTANLNVDDLKAAVASIDDTMDALPGTLNGAQSVKTNFVQGLPEPFLSNSTNQQKAMALMVWAMKEVGLI